jgi:hypothetical protein
MTVSVDAGRRRPHRRQLLQIIKRIEYLARHVVEPRIPDPEIEAIARDRPDPGSPG